MVEFIVLIRGGDDVYQVISQDEAQGAVQKYIS